MEHREKALHVLGRLVAFCLVIMISLPIDYAAVRYLPPFFHHPGWFQGEYSEEKVHSWDSWDSEKYVSFDRAMSSITDRIAPLWERLGLIKNVSAAELPQSEDPSTEAAIKEIAPTNNSIQIRLGFWNYYLRGGTLRGHSNEEGHQIPGMEWYWYVWHTQNLFLQFWYYYGIPAAISLVLWLLAMGATAIKGLLKGQSGALFLLLFWLVFVIFGMPEAVWYPGQFVLLLAFLGPVVIPKT